MNAKEILKEIVKSNYDKPTSYTQNLLKEYLQILILKHIYSSSEYKDLFFYGGTCLAHCYNLPRLSEDLGFVDVKQNIDIEKLAKDTKSFFEKKTGLSPEIKTQKFRIYFKFPILKELGLAKDDSFSDLLFVKIEVFSDFTFCDKFKEEFKPIFKFNHPVVVKTFDLSTLMSTKVRAVLYRKWEKTNKKGDTLTSVKGRDFFDLLWFLQNKVEPNFDCIEEANNKEELKIKLLERVEDVDEKSIIFDLNNFIADSNFTNDLGKNIKSILKTEIERW